MKKNKPFNQYNLNNVIVDVCPKSNTNLGLSAAQQNPAAVPAIVAIFLCSATIPLLWRG